MSDEMNVVEPTWTAEEFKDAYTQPGRSLKASLVMDF